VSRLRGDLYQALNDLPGLQPFPGTANFLLVRGPEGLAARLTRRGLLVRGCGPFMGLSPGYFRVAVRGEAENRRLISALREEL
jgi:histidinol-phosphate/aromatic aminotransferase/cobyric acid decarboxylase-like protein